MVDSAGHPVQARHATEGAQFVVHRQPIALDRFTIHDVRPIEASSGNEGSGGATCQGASRVMGRHGLGAPQLGGRHMSGGAVAPEDACLASSMRVWDVDAKPRVVLVHTVEYFPCIWTEGVIGGLRVCVLLVLPCLSLMYA